MIRAPSKTFRIRRRLLTLLGTAMGAGRIRSAPRIPTATRITNQGSRRLLKSCRNNLRFPYVKAAIGVSNRMGYGTAGWSSARPRNRLSDHVFSHAPRIERAIQARSLRARSSLRTQRQRTARGRCARPEIRARHGLRARWRTHEGMDRPLSLEQMCRFSARVPRANSVSISRSRRLSFRSSGWHGVEEGSARRSASYYYSMPHLQVRGRLSAGKTQTQVAGSAWLDHEWSSSYMDEGAVGWDWIGVNLDDGGALMAFRMRDGAGGKLWAGATLRARDGTRTALDAKEVVTRALRHRA